MIGALLLALALQGEPEAAALNPPSAAEPTLMIVEFPQGARYIGEPRRCPGVTEEISDDAICHAELYQGRATVVRHLSGPRVGGSELLRLSGHARFWPPGIRVMVATHPFIDHGTRGNGASWWMLPVAGDEFCVPVDSLGSLDDVLGRAFASGYARRFRPRLYRERTDFRCIRSARPDHR